MNEQTENTQTEPETTTAAPVQSVGDIMTEAQRASIKKVVLLISIAVYIGGIIYAEVHGLTILTKGIDPNMRFWATLGMIAAGASAIGLPLALKSWCFEHTHRMAAYVFYALDGAFLAFNAFTDFNVNTGQQLAPWAQTYVNYVLPSSPLIVAALWALLWELDPSTRAHVLRQTLRAAIIEAKANQITQAARSEAVTKQVQDAAQSEVDQALTDLFGRKVTAVRDEEDDGWQIWKDGYQQGKRYQSTAPQVLETEEKKPETGGPFPSE